MRTAKRVGFFLTALAVTVLLLACPTQPETEETQTQQQETEQEAEDTAQEQQEAPQEEPEQETQEQAAAQAEPEFTTVRIQFEADSAVLLAQERQKLLSYAPILREYPDIQLLIKGHAARFGEEESSQVLSEQRAQRVADFIMDQSGVDESQLTVVGVGSREPEADNATPAGRARNRRVVISVLGY